MTDIARAQRFVDLHREGCFLLPNVWDAGSARLFESVGFDAVATTSAGIAFSHGRPDHDFFTEHPDGGRLDRGAMLDKVRGIAGSVDIPVSADLEEGYGEEPEAVARTIVDAMAAGAVGGNIEDFTGSRERPLFEHSLAVERLRAARAAVDAAGAPFVLVGRTDSLLVGGTLQDSIARANAYLAAGADCAFVPGASDAETISTLARDLDGPLNVVMGLTGNALSMAGLADLGVRRVTVGGSVARAMYSHLRAVAQELRVSGTFSYAQDQISQSDLNQIFGPRARD